MLLPTGYLDVDIAVVHRLLNDELADFTEFARRVNAFIGPAEEG